MAIGWHGRRPHAARSSRTAHITLTGPVEIQCLGARCRDDGRSSPRLDAGADVVVGDGSFDRPSSRAWDFRNLAAGYTAMRVPVSGGERGGERRCRRSVDRGGLIHDPANAPPPTDRGRPPLSVACGRAVDDRVRVRRIERVRPEIALEGSLITLYPARRLTLATPGDA